MPLHAVVLAGGAGTRFWPASRRAAPKPFIPLLGGRTPFRATLERLRRLAPKERTWVVTPRELLPITRAALRGERGVRLLSEPAPRDTAAAVVWAAARIAAEDPEALVAVFPSDHHIPNPEALARAVRRAARAAMSGEGLVLIGIEPTHPDPAYGYFRLGRRVSGSAHAVQRFVEKPDRARARRYLARGDYLWNSGMLVARASRILAEARAHARELWRPAGSVFEQIARRARVSRVTFERCYRAIPSLPFDRAVLERTRRAWAIRGRFRWSDLGSWDALEAHLSRKGGNRVAAEGPLVSVSARENVVWSRSERAIALVGLRDFVVVDTDDALLVCPKGRAQDVRRIVEELVRHGRGDLT